MWTKQSQSPRELRGLVAQNLKKLIGLGKDLWKNTAAIDERIDSQPNKLMP